MKKDFDLENMMLNEVEHSISLKDKIETKAVGYISGVALILNILLGFYSEGKKIDCELARRLCMIFFILSFFVGAILLLCFSIMLFPRTREKLNFNEILSFRQNAELSSDEISKQIIENCQSCIETNNKTAKKLKIYNKIISIGLVLLSVLFVFDAILYFNFV